jgi:hypothetical protein
MNKTSYEKPRAGYLHIYSIITKVDTIHILGKHKPFKVTLHSTASFCSLSEGQPPTLPLIQ